MPWKKTSSQQNVDEKDYDDHADADMLFDVVHELDGEDKIILYHRRWFILGLFALSAMMTSVIQMSFAPIQSAMLIYYDRPNDRLNNFFLTLFPQTYNITNVPCGIVAAMVSKKFGLRFSFLIGALGHVIGTMLRVFFATQPYEWGFFGLLGAQTLCSLVQPFIVYCTTTMAYNWFGEKERTLATSIAAFCNIFGTALAFALGFIVTDNGSTLYINLSIQAAFCILLAILSILFFSSKPPTPPSRTSQSNTTVSNFNSFRLLISNCSFWLLMITYSVGFGVISAILAVLGQILTPQGYTQTDSSIYGLIIITVGLVGCVVFGVIADRTKRFKLCLWLCACGALVGVSIFCVGMFFQKTVYWFWINLGAFIILGVFSVPFVPLSLEIACDITYPASPSVPNTVLGLTGTIAGTIFTFLFPLLQAKQRPDGSPGDMHIPLLVGVGCFLVAMSGLVCFRGKMRRTEAEAKAKLANDSHDEHEDSIIDNDKARLLSNTLQPTDLLASSYGALEGEPENAS